MKKYQIGEREKGMGDFEIAELLHSKLGLAYYVLNGKPAPPIPRLYYEGCGAMKWI